MKIPSTRGLGNYQAYGTARQMNRAARKQKNGQANQMTTIDEAMINSQITLDPNLSDSNCHRDIKRHLLDYII